MKMLTIAFPNGGILPADADNPKERSVLPHTPVDVPVTYGEQLVRDHFAYVFDPKAQGTIAAKADSASDTDDKKLLSKDRKVLDARERAVEAREKAADQAASEFDARVEKITASQKAIIDARATFAAAADDAAKATAGEALTKAEAEFAALAELKA